MSYVEHSVTDLKHVPVRVNGFIFTAQVGQVAGGQADVTIYGVEDRRTERFPVAAVGHAVRTGQPLDFDFVE